MLRKPISVVGLYPPIPFIGHLCLCNGLDMPYDLDLAELVGADPGRIKLATHMADLVDSALEGENSASDESPQEIISHPTIFHELNNGHVDLVDLGVGFLGVEGPIESCCGGAEDKRR